MTSSIAHRRRSVLAAAALGLLGAALAPALPAGAHASIPASPTLGFAPNPAGGTGALGTTAPYAPGAFTTITLRAAGEQTVPFNGSPDTNVDVRAIVPAGWTNPQCGPAKLQVNTEATNKTNQPGADAPGWSCEVIVDGGHSVVRWSGPQVIAPATVEDSPAFFVFSVTTPSPATQTTYDGTNGTEGFIVDQMYASGALSHWIPNAAYPGTAPAGTTRTDVATGLVRTVAGPGTAFTAVTPTRLLDSRGATGGWASPLVAGTPRTLTVIGGAAAVPAEVDAVVVNLTATGSTSPGYLSAYPAGSAQPNSSNLNFAGGQTVASLAVVKVGTGGAIAFAASANTDVVVDLVGYYSAAGTGRYNAVDPSRVLDSRGATGGWSGKIGADETRLLTVTGSAGVPSTATAVTLNLTGINASANTYLTVYPDGDASPTASSLNVAAGQTVANLVTVKVGTGGRLAIRNYAGSLDVVADVVGYHDAATGDLFHSLAPRRLLDSRVSVGGWTTALGAGPARALGVTGLGGVRTDAHSFLATVTVTDTTADGFLTVFPAGATQPSASTLNFTAGSTVPNLVAMKTGRGGQVSIAASAGSAHVVLDVVGYFSAT